MRENIDNAKNIKNVVNSQTVINFISQFAVAVVT